MIQRRPPGAARRRPRARSASSSTSPASLFPTACWKQERERLAIEALAQRTGAAGGVGARGGVPAPPTPTARTRTRSARSAGVRAGEALMSAALLPLALLAGGRRSRGRRGARRRPRRRGSRARARPGTAIVPTQAAPAASVNDGHRARRAPARGAGAAEGAGAGRRHTSSAPAGMRRRCEIGGARGGRASSSTRAPLRRAGATRSASCWSCCSTRTQRPGRWRGGDGPGRGRACRPFAARAATRRRRISASAGASRKDRSEAGRPRSGWRHARATIAGLPARRRGCRRKRTTTVPAVSRLASPSRGWRSADRRAATRCTSLWGSARSSRSAG